MQRMEAIDSVVLQALKDGDRHTAEKLADVLGGKLDVLRSYPVRSSKENQKRWREATGERFPKSAAFVALIHHERGQSIPLIRYGNGKHIVIQFRGLQQYEEGDAVLNDGAIQRGFILQELLQKYDGMMRLVRLDMCIDHVGSEWSGYTNSRTHRALSKRHGTAMFKGGTIYYQPPKPQYVKIYAYDKQKANTLRYPLVRVEYSFKGQYWRNAKAMRATELIDWATAKAQKFIAKVTHA